MNDGAHRDRRLSARDQHLRALARDTRGVRDRRRVAGADHRTGASGPGPGHEPAHRRVHRRGGALRVRLGAHDLGVRLAVVLRHRACLRAHRQAHSGRAAGRAAVRRRVPLPARGDGGRAPGGRRRRAAATGTHARRRGHSRRRLARLPFQHDPGDGGARERARRLPHLPACRHGRHGPAHRPVPRRIARRIGAGAPGVSPDPVHDSAYLAVHDERADAVHHGDARRSGGRGGDEPHRGGGLPGRGHPSLRAVGVRLRAVAGRGRGRGGRAGERDRAKGGRVRGRAPLAGRRRAAGHRDRAHRVPTGGHRGYPGQPRRRGRLRHHRNAPRAGAQRRPQRRHSG